MKKKKIIYILLGVLLISVSKVLAQDTEKNKEKPDAINSNWYIEVGGGAQLLFSKDANKLSFTDRITPSVSLTTGKWFSPYWGLRLQLQGYSFNGFSTTEGLYLANPLDNGSVYGPKDPVRDEVTIRPDGSYRHYLRYANLHVDFQFSSINLICGVDDKRKWDIIPSIGLGYMHMFSYKGTPDNDVMTANFSLMGKYKLTKNIDINLEVQTAVMPDQFDGRITGRQYENNCAAMLGVTYHFKKRGFNSRKPIYIPREVIRVERDTVLITKEVPVEVEKKVFNEPFLLTSIRFGLNQYKPIKGQEMIFVNIVKYLDTNPYAKIRLDGYADPIGAADYNLRLSGQRAAWIREILMKEYGVDGKRIEVQGIGTDGQPYKESTWNRVVVVTAIEKRE